MRTPHQLKGMALAVLQMSRREAPTALPKAGAKSDGRSDLRTPISQMSLAGEARQNSFRIADKPDITQRRSVSRY